MIPDRLAESRTGPEGCPVRHNPLLIPWKVLVRGYVAVLACGVLTSAVVIGGAGLGIILHPADALSTMPNALARWDGQLYRSIVSGGYIYNPAKGSRIAFFPGYPLAARWIARSLGLSDVAALLAVSNVCFLIALLAAAAYLPRRNAPLNDDRARPRRVGIPLSQSYAIIAIAVMPTSFFFRMAYSESMFLAAVILAMVAMKRNWPLVAIALAVGLSTAIRPVGIGLLLPFGWHMRQRSASRYEWAGRAMILGPLACWGLLAFMLFQYLRFHQPFAFALTQANWRIRPPGTFADKALSLSSWQPLWGVYLEDSWGYWRAVCRPANPFFNLQFANPIYFIATAGLVAVGAWRRWLSAEELLLSAALIAIPYATRAYEMCMASQGRFAAVVFPVYIVIGELLSRVPAIVVMSILSFSAFLMAAYAALFAAGYPLI